MLKEQDIVLSLLDAFNRVKITQEEVAKKTAMSRTTLSGILNGHRSASVANLVKIVNVLNEACPGCWQFPKSNQ